MEADVKKQTQPQKAALRLFFQGSIPFEEPLQAESWYTMLKEMVKSQSPSSTLNGQVSKMLEPCCGERLKTTSLMGVTSIEPDGLRRL